LAQNPLKITKRNERFIAGEITTSTQQPLIMTTIPDSPGWHVTLDGHKVLPYKVADYFIAIKAKPGKHTIQFKYTPPLFSIGLLISLLGALVLLFTITHQKKLARKRSA